MDDALMDTDWSVELGADDPALEFPWTSPDGTHGFVDLSERKEALATLPEMAQYPELGEFLLVLNGKLSPWLTAKCDVWIDDDLGPAEEIYAAKLKVCSYVDLVRRNESERFSFEYHEKFVKFAAANLPDVGGDHLIACEFIVRRCWYHRDSSTNDETEPGFYITLYIFGYGDDEAQAGAMWSGGLTRVSGAIALSP
jgi:hypothetical protein